MSVQSMRTIQTAIAETPKLIEFTQLVRGPDNDFSGRYSVKAADLNHLFQKTQWELQITKNGHRKWVHPLTRVVVEYVDRKNEIDPGAVTTILNQVQTHINRLHNDILQSRTKSWREAVDLRAAAQRLDQRAGPSGG